MPSDPEFDREILQFNTDKKMRDFLEQQKEEVRKAAMAAAKAGKSYSGIKLQRGSKYTNSSGETIRLKFSITISWDPDKGEKGEVRAFALGKNLGRGGFGEVRISRDLDNPSKKSVVKVYRTFQDSLRPKEADPEKEKRKVVRRGVMGHYHRGNQRNIDREIRKLKAVGQFYGLTQTKDKVYVQQEEVQGTDLNYYINKRSRTRVSKEDLSFDNLVLAQGLCNGLKKLHDANIIHRDIKPDNAMYDPSTETVRFIDMGTSVNLTLGKTALYEPDKPRTKADSRSGSKSGLTPGGAGFASDMGKLVGTRGYVAPEILSGGLYSKSSDVYALGQSLLDLFSPVPDNPELSAERNLEARIKGVEDPKIAAIIRKTQDNVPSERPSIDDVLAVIDAHPELAIHRQRQEYYRQEQKENDEMTKGFAISRVRVSLLDFSNINKDISSIYEKARKGKWFKGSPNIGRTEAIQRIQMQINALRDETNKDIKVLNIKVLNEMVEKLQGELNSTIKGIDQNMRFYHRESDLKLICQTMLKELAPIGETLKTLPRDKIEDIAAANEPTPHAVHMALDNSSTATPRLRATPPPQDDSKPKEDLPPARTPPKSPHL